MSDEVKAKDPTATQEPATAQLVGSSGVARQRPGGRDILPLLPEHGSKTYRIERASVLGPEDDNDAADNAEGHHQPFQGFTPLTLGEFQSVLTTVDALGWTWTTDSPPALKPKKPSTREDTELPGAIAELATRYPSFPSELGTVIDYALLGWSTKHVADIEAKSQIVSDVLLTDEYRSQYFFENTIRGKRFVDIDWEIVVKFAERNINRTPASAHALLTLETAEQQPDDDKLEAVSFAADEKSLHHMISLLQDALKALEEARSRCKLIRDDVSSARGGNKT